MADRVASLRSRPGEPSRAFSALVGHTLPAADLRPADLLIDPTRFPSEGDWAFCRFDDERIPALRMGFQRGGFNVWPEDRPVDPELLQLHLEVLTADGAHLWLPTGTRSAALLLTDPTVKDIRLAQDGLDLLRISGWPSMSWYARSDDDALEVALTVDVGSVTVLPDCLLPHAVFAMWETVGDARGWVRIGAETTPVRGRMFYDHTRVLHREHALPGRQGYLYTTLALDDGGALLGYHATDVLGQPIEDYCFGVHVDAIGHGTYLPDTGAPEIELDADGLPARYRIDWRGPHLAVTADVTVRPMPIIRAWGSPSAPTSRAAFPILPLVLDARVTLEGATGPATQRGIGLAEHFDATAWAAQIPD